MLQASGAKENVSVLVIRLNTDRGPSLARLRPTRQVMSIDDVEAAMAHDAALKALRAARAEREAAIASLTSAAANAAADATPPPSHALSAAPASPPLVAGNETGSSLSGYTARMSFASSGDRTNDDDEATPRNSSETLSSESAASSPLSPTAQTSGGSSSSSSTLFGQTLRVEFTTTDDDDDELMKKLIQRATASQTGCNDDDEEDVDVDDRFVRDIIRSELPPLTAGSAAVAAVQRQPRRRQRPPTDVPQPPPPTTTSAVIPPSLPRVPRFVKKSAELGGPPSLRRPDAVSCDASSAAELSRRFASSSSSSRTPGSLDFDVEAQFVAAKARNEISQTPVVTYSDRHFSPSASRQTPAWRSNVSNATATPPSPVDSCVGEAPIQQYGDTQFFVEVARF